MNINGWNVEFDNNYSGFIIGVTKKYERWSVAVRSRGVYIIKRPNIIHTIASEHHDLPKIFAEYLSNDKNAEKKIKSVLTKLKKLCILEEIKVF